jgi:hypothetical protein
MSHYFDLNAYQEQQNIRKLKQAQKQGRKTSRRP